MSSHANSTADARWFQRSGGEPTPQTRLFCFPYAGSSAGVYYGWSKKLPATTELAAVQFPGRENRLNDPPVRSMAEAASAVADAMEPLLDLPYCLFGYSLGGLIAFETLRTLRRRRRQLPQRLFVAAISAPRHSHGRTPPIHQLPREALIEEIRRFQGTPEVVLRNAEVMSLIIPMIRADFEVLETYHCQDEPPLEVPIFAYGGLDDPEVSPDRLAEWIDYTSAGFSMQFLPGDHFFLKTAQDQLLEMVSRELQSSLAVAESKP